MWRNISGYGYCDAGMCWTRLGRGLGPTQTSWAVCFVQGLVHVFVALKRTDPWCEEPGSAAYCGAEYRQSRTSVCQSMRVGLRIICRECLSDRILKLKICQPKFWKRSSMCSNECNGSSSCRGCACSTEQMGEASAELYHML